MKKSILLAVFAVALFAMPAFASVQNVKVSGGVASTFIHRAGFDFGNDINSTGGTNHNETLRQDVFITQTILNVDADLTDNVSVAVGLINERPWNKDNGTAATDIDLYRAYVKIREALYSPLTVIVGRQPFAYGNSFIIDSAGANNSAVTDSGISGSVTGIANDLTKQRSQDAIRAVFDYNPLTLEFLWSKISSNRVVAEDGARANDDTDLFGADARYELGDAWKTGVEAYVFYKTDKGLNVSSFPANKTDTILVPGFRVSTNVLDGLNLQGEIAWQTGNKVVSTTQSQRNTIKRDALGAQFIANYQIPVNDDMKKYNPNAQYVFTHVSGDHSASDVIANQGTGVGLPASSERHTAWDPMFENQSRGKIYNTLFNLSNANIHEAKFSFSPMEDVTAAVSWTGLWLDRKLAPGTTALTLLQPDGTTRSENVDRDKRGLGNEVDVTATYNLTEDVQAGVNLGWYIPGNLFASPSDEIASQALVNLDVAF